MAVHPSIGPEFDPSQEPWKTWLQEMGSCDGVLADFEEDVSYGKLIENRRSLLRQTHGLRLGSFALGTRLWLETDPDPNGHSRSLDITLIPWPKQTANASGQVVRAYINDATNLFGIEADIDIQIYGPSIKNTMLEPRHYGEIRRGCNLYFAPLTFLPVTQDYLQYDLEEARRRGQIERATRGEYSGQDVILELQAPPLILPPVHSVSICNPETQDLIKQPWLAPRALES